MRRLEKIKCKRSRLSVNSCDKSWRREEPMRNTLNQTDNLERLHFFT